MLDSQAEVQGLEAELRRLRQEVRSDAPRIPCPSPRASLVLWPPPNPAPSRPNPSG